MDTSLASSEGVTATHWRPSWRYASREIALIVGAYFAYFLVRGFSEGSPERAFANASDVIAFQQRVGLDWEIAMQGWIAGSQLGITLANWVYIYGHWPTIAVIAFWLLWAHPREYRLVRNSFLISGAIGLLIFATYPVAPPRLVDSLLSKGLIDTVTQHSNSYRVLQPPALVNQYAAVPSLHFGWNLLIGIVVTRVARTPILRLFGIVMPPVMFLSIVLTGNHYVIDGVFGALVAMSGLSGAVLIRRYDGQLAPGLHRWWRARRA